jgi:TolB protein
VNGTIYFDQVVVGGPAPAHSAWVMNGDGGSQTKIVGSGTAASQPHPSYDGRLLAFTNQTANGPSVSVINGDGSGTTVTVTAGSAPAWSPDGAKVAYVGPFNTAGGLMCTFGAGLWVANADGSGTPTPLLPAGDCDTASAPAWSPDGSQIAFADAPLSQTAGIDVVSPSGSTPTPLTPAGSGDGHPDWSPDGKSIAFDRQAMCNGGACSNVLVMSSTGANPVQLTPGGQRIFAQEPSFSPDGTQIAFATGLGTALNIWTMATNGSSTKQLTTGGTTSEPQWAANRRPSASLAAPSSGSGGVVTFNGTVTAAGIPTSFQFLYSTDPGLAGATAVPSMPASAGSALGAAPVSQSVTGLQPQATYYYALKASNVAGAVQTPTQAVSSPFLSSGQPSVTGSSTAGFSGSVNPEGLPTTAHFEYGLDSKYQLGSIYSQQTPEQPAGSDATVHPVSTTVSGLVPNALYHVRIVATNPLGATDGPDQTFMTAKDPTPPTPTLGKTFNAAPSGGLVYIKLPGQHVAADGITKGAGFIPLTEARQLPPGTVVDARAGGLRLVAAAATVQHIGKTQNGTFSSGLFKISSQTRTGIQKGLTTLTLQEDIFPGSPSYKSCTAHAASSDDPFAFAAISKRVLQALHASVHGRFRTRGRFAAGTVRGTAWEIDDRCDGTWQRVHRGTVDVFDFRLRKTIPVRAGHVYLAKAIQKRSIDQIAPEPVHQ